MKGKTGRVVENSSNTDVILRMTLLHISLFKIRIFICSLLLLALTILFYFYGILQSLRSSAIVDNGSNLSNICADEFPPTTTTEWDTTKIVTDGSRKTPYVTLSPKNIWPIDTLRDLFAEQPKCREHYNQKSANTIGPYLLILITSAITNFDQRMAIRNTWGTKVHAFNSNHNYHSSRSYKSIFLVGKPPTDILDFLIEEESGRYGDILRGNYLDSYRNLTLKVLHGFSYANQSCQPKYVLKTDDDCFVNVPLILHFMQSQNNLSKTLYVGKTVKTDRRKVIRNFRNKWHVSPLLYRKEFYPPYPSGHGYVISGHLLPFLMDAASKIFPFPNEDAFIGVVMNSIGIRPIHTDRFSLSSSHWRPCNLLYLMIIHGIKAKEQKFLLRAVATAQNKCPGHVQVTTW